MFRHWRRECSQQNGVISPRKWRHITQGLLIKTMENIGAVVTNSNFLFQESRQCGKSFSQPLKKLPEFFPLIRDPAGLMSLSFLYLSSFAFDALPGALEKRAPKSRGPDSKHMSYKC